MMSSARSAWASQRSLRSLMSLGLSVCLFGCTAWTPITKNDDVLLGPAPYMNETPMNAALYCLRQYTKLRDLRLGVADFVDGTGATPGNGDLNGRYFSQRPDMMLLVAMNKAGVRIVNRTSTAVAEWELRQAMEKKLGDGKPDSVGKQHYDYRPVRAGEILGSNYYIHGAITEINWALSNNVEEYGFLGVTAGKQVYRVSMAVDVAVTNSETTEVVFARSYAKQLVGYQVGGGVFRFMDVTLGPTHTELFESNVGDKKNEPVQRALRWLIESAAYDVVAEMEGRHQSCDSLVPGLDRQQPRDHVGLGGLVPFIGSQPGQPAEPPPPRPKPAAAHSPAPERPAAAVHPKAPPAPSPATPEHSAMRQDTASPRHARLAALRAPLPSKLRLPPPAVPLLSRFVDGIDIASLPIGRPDAKFDAVRLAREVAHLLPKRRRHPVAQHVAPLAAVPAQPADEGVSSVDRTAPVTPEPVTAAAAAAPAPADTAPAAVATIVTAQATAAPRTTAPPQDDVSVAAPAEAAAALPDSGLGHDDNAVPMPRPTPAANVATSGRGAWDCVGGGGAGVRRLAGCADGIGSGGQVL